MTCDVRCWSSWCSMNLSVNSLFLSPKRVRICCVRILVIYISLTVQDNMASVRIGSPRTSAILSSCELSRRVATASRGETVLSDMDVPTQLRQRRSIPSITYQNSMSSEFQCAISRLQYQHIVHLRPGKHWEPNALIGMAHALGIKDITRVVNSINVAITHFHTATCIGMDSMTHCASA